MEMLSGFREVGSETFDNCSNDNLRVVGGINGDVTIRKGESKFIELRDYQTELIWYCGDSDERSACGSDFVAVQIERRSGNDRRFGIKFYARS
jgi:hypothetical protein